MSKITLDVDKNDVNTILVILNNLKSGLVKNIAVDSKNVTNSIQTKKAAKQAVLEDEFMSKAPSTSKYMSRNAYKNKLNTNN